MRIPRLGLTLLVATTMDIIGAASNEVINCCIPPFAYFDCTGAGHAVSPGKVYTCENTASLTGCMNCLGTIKDGNDTCTTCCTIASDSECRTLESDWEFYASTVFFVFLCCCFSVLCGLTEVRRKKKGISFAQAWSVPQAMPILRTWPGRSVSASDALHTEGQGEDQHWAPLPDDEEDLKHYPVAGLVDDSGVAFGFVSSMPQSFMRSVATSLGRPGPTAMNPPPSPQEPELTVYISRERDQGGSRRSTRPGRSVSTEVTAGTNDSDVDVDVEGSRDSREGGRAVVVGGGLEEPLFVGETGPDRGIGDARGSIRNSAARYSEDVAEAGEHAGH